MGRQCLTFVRMGFGYFVKYILLYCKENNLVSFTLDEISNKKKATINQSNVYVTDAILHQRYFYFVK